MVGKRKKNRLLTDAFREVKNTRSRFFSILILSALAVAFLSGIKITAPDMQYTADRYYDRLNVMDGYVISTLGLVEEDLEALEKGLPNLLQHVENITKVYKLPAVVAVNRFPTDTEAELALVEKKCRELGVNVALSEVWAKGGEGGEELANEVVRLCGERNEFTFSYDDEDSIGEKLNKIAQKIYHADGVDLVGDAPKQLKQLTRLGFGKLPICVAKTQYSFSDDPNKLGAPKGFRISVRNLKVSAGAGFIVALTGDIMTMPGLPKVPAAEKIDVDSTGRISGLF